MKGINFTRFSVRCLCLLFIIFSIPVFSQPFAVGHRSLTYNDSVRNRDIPVHVYYPGVSAGDNVSFVAGQFPLIVYGHGFSMPWSAYEYLWDALVPLGYIMVFPTTEGSAVSPNHDAFGKDLRFLNLKMKSEGLNSSSSFYQKITSASALMGHSMGGGASILGAVNNNDITILVNFAAAETTPSAINECPAITCPVLLFYGENDGVAPPVDHQLPMYSALGADCKTLIGIEGGGHCFFADYNLSCSTVEFFTSPQPTISREDQHEVTLDLLVPFLDFYLKNNMSSGQLFLDSLYTSSRIIYQRNCQITNMSQKIYSGFSIFPNPIALGSTLKCILQNDEKPAMLSIKDLFGRIIYASLLTKLETSFPIYSIDKGLYVVEIQQGRDIFVQKLVIK